ncbi:MAG TPA: PQQ-binding-like beta-propeller repeat protein [Chryseolinea sp.]
MKRPLLCTFFLILFGTTVTHAQVEEPTILNPIAKWKFKTQGPIRGSSVADNSTIYFGSADGHLYAVNKNNGELVWKFKTESPISSTPALSGMLVLISSNNNSLYAVDRSTGKLVWKYLMQPSVPSYCSWDYYTASPVVEGSRVFIGSGDSHLYALSMEGKLLWKYKTNGRIRTAALIKDGKVFQPSNDGTVYVLNAQDGKLLWKFETDGSTYDSRKFGWDRNSIYASPILLDSIMIVASRDGKTYAVNTVTHKKKWDFTYGPTWAMSAAGEYNVAYIGWSDNSLLSAIDVQTGKEKWKFQSGSLVYTKPVLTGRDIYFGSADENLYCLQKSSGEKRWSYKTGGCVYSSPTIDSKVVFVGSDDGFFYAIGESANPYKAVYLPIPKDPRLEAFTIDKKITPYLKDHGFEQLDSAKLFRFLQSRINDGAPSVIVFAYDQIPSNMIGEEPEKGMIRQYLEKGGKIIWPGSPPNLYSLDSKGKPKLDETIAERMLGIDISRPEESGNYYSQATQTGLNWGLPSWLTVTYSTIEPKGVTALAHDEYNRVSAWLKKFNERPGSGFVSCRTWGWYANVHDEDLKLIYDLAVHGLE